MLYSGRKAVTTAGTKVPLLASTVDWKDAMASWCTVIADKDNTGYVYVGNDDVQNNAAGAKTYIGHPLAKGTFVNLRELGGPTYLDLRTVYIDADTNADAVTFNYGRR